MPDRMNPAARAARAIPPTALNSSAPLTLVKFLHALDTGERTRIKSCAKQERKFRGKSCHEAS
jgi:hypothetical protein